MIDEDYTEGAEGGSGTHVHGPNEESILQGSEFVETYWKQKKLNGRGQPTDQREPVQFQVSTGNRKRILQVYPPDMRKRHVSMWIAGTATEVAKIEFENVNELNPELVRSLVQTGLTKLKKEICIKCNHPEIGKSGDFCHKCVFYHIHGDHEQKKLQDYKTETCPLCEMDLKLGSTFVAHCCEAAICVQCFDKYTRTTGPNPTCPFCRADVYKFLPIDSEMHPINSPARLIPRRR